MSDVEGSGEHAIHWGTKKRTYTEVHDRAARLANGVRVLGLGPGDRFAIVLRTLTEARVCEYVAGRLAKYKAPRIVVFDDSLPRDDNGKLFKRRLRERYLTAAQAK